MSIFRKSAMVDGSPKGEGPLRYRLYYWLMNAAFVWQLGATIIFDFVGLEPKEQAAWVWAVLSVAVLGFQLVIMPLLVALPVWRDEYAETLWKRTVYQIATLVAVVVPIMLFANIALHLTLELKQIPEPILGWYKGLFAEVTIFRGVMGAWDYFTLVFTALFQFNRWRDSRAASE